MFVSKLSPKPDFDMLAAAAFGSRDEIIPIIAGRKPNNNIPTGPRDPPSLN